MRIRIFSVLAAFAVLSNPLTAFAQPAPAHTVVRSSDCKVTIDAAGNTTFSSCSPEEINGVMSGRVQMAQAQQSSRTETLRTAERMQKNEILGTIGIIIAAGGSQRLCGRNCRGNGDYGYGNYGYSYGGYRNGYECAYYPRTCRNGSGNVGANTSMVRPGDNAPVANNYNSGGSTDFVRHYYPNSPPSSGSNVNVTMCRGEPNCER